jgi:hypothetical protein
MYRRQEHPEKAGMELSCVPSMFSAWKAKGWHRSHLRVENFLGMELKAGMEVDFHAEDILGT